MFSAFDKDCTLIIWLISLEGYIWKLNWIMIYGASMNSCSTFSLYKDASFRIDPICSSGDCWWSRMEGRRMSKLQRPPPPPHSMFRFTVNLTSTKTKTIHPFILSSSSFPLFRLGDRPSVRFVHSFILSMARKVTIKSITYCSGRMNAPEKIPHENRCCINIFLN